MKTYKILRLWQLLRPFPLGNLLFSRLLGRLVPYSGSIPAKITHLEAGFARLVMTDSRAIRNHLGSIHAIALANLAELASGLALNTALNQEQRSILVKFQISYLKKARGTLTANCRIDPRVVLEPNASHHKLSVEILDQSQELTCQAVAEWKVSSSK